MKVKDWLDTTERNTPEGYPNLTCGWPDVEHGITWGYYIDTLIDRLENLDEGDPLPKLPSFHEWKHWKREEDEDLDNLGFSPLKCDLCGAKAGERYAATALPTNPAENHDYAALSVCGECLCYIANGDVPDWLEGEND